MLEVSGSHYEVGLAIGRRFAERISSAVAQCQSQLPSYQNFIRSNKPYFKATETAFPELIEELAGVAAGSGVSPEDYFFLTNPDIKSSATPYLKRLHLEGDHCSILVSFNGDGVIVGHNEDFDPEAQDDLYLLKAVINGVPIFGIQYITEMIGASASINGFGLIQCINELHSGFRLGIPKNFIARAVLQCQNLDEAEKLITQVQHASGFNHVLVQGSQITNIEIAGAQIAVTHFQGEPFIHTNHYLSPGLQAAEKYHTASSRHRYRRLKELVRPGMSLADVETVLRDHAHPRHAICRHDHTLGSIIFEPSKHLAHVCYGRPCEGEYKTYELSS